MAMTALVHSTRYVREIRGGVSYCWQSASRRERQQTLITLALVTIVATLILAGLLAR